MRVYRGFYNMKRLGVFLFPLDWRLVNRRVTPCIKFAGTYLYTWVEGGTARVTCLAQEHSTMPSSGIRTWPARSRDERTNHEATAHQHLEARTCYRYQEGTPRHDCLLLKTCMLGYLYEFCTLYQYISKIATLNLLLN